MPLMLTPRREKGIHSAGSTTLQVPPLMLTPHREKGIHSAGSTTLQVLASDADGTS
jgi:hypothetical protein